MASGRPKASPVWAYFNYNESAKESVRCIEKDEAYVELKLMERTPQTLRNI